MSAVDVLHLDVALPLKGWLEEERDDEDEADDRRDDQRLQGRPRRVDELPSDHVQHGLVGGPIPVPGKWHQGENFILPVRSKEASWSLNLTSYARCYLELCL